MNLPRADAYPHPLFALTYDQFVYESAVYTHGKEMADWLAKEFGWKIDRTDKADQSEAST